MRAEIVTRYGGPEAAVIGDVPVPEPRAGEVLVRVAAAAVTAGDARLRGSRFPPGFGALSRLAMGVRGPRARTLGNSLSGVVERVGPGVTEFAPGDDVAGMTGARMRAHAEYAILPVRSAAAKPAGVSHPDAAGALFGGSTALSFLRDRGKIRAWESVLINGASGSVGTSTVQLARYFGATVTAVSSAANHPLLSRIGADRAIDYREHSVATLTDRFDIVVDTVGNLTLREGLALLTPGGRLALVAAGLSDTIRAGKRVLAGPAPERAADIALLLGLLDSGDLEALTTVAGSLDDLPEAYRVVDSGRKVGNLVVQPGGNTGGQTRT